MTAIVEVTDDRKALIVRILAENEIEEMVIEMLDMSTPTFSVNDSGDELVATLRNAE